MSNTITLPRYALFGDAEGFDMVKSWTEGSCGRWTTTEGTVLLRLSDNTFWECIYQAWDFEEAKFYRVEPREVKVIEYFRV
jgi:hypothetical protein